MIGLLNCGIIINALVALKDGVLLLFLLLYN